MQGLADSSCYQTRWSRARRMRKSITVQGGIWSCEYGMIARRVIPTRNTALTRARFRDAMEGFDAVVFAYGQTASGKTFTLVRRRAR